MTLIIEAEDIMSKNEITEDWREKYKSQQKYEALYTKRVTFKLNLKTEADIVEAIESADNKQRFIKDAIRFYIANKSKGE